MESSKNTMSRDLKIYFPNPMADGNGLIFWKTLNHLFSCAGMLGDIHNLHNA